MGQLAKKVVIDIPEQANDTYRMLPVDLGWAESESQVQEQANDKCRI